MATAKRDGLYKRKGSRFWWVRTDPLDGVPRSTGCTDLEAAKLWRATRERLAADPAHAAAQAATLCEWVGRIVAMKHRTASPKTADYYEAKLGHVLRVWGDDCRLATIDAVKIDSYVKQRRHEGASDHTISKEWSCLVYLLRAAKQSKCYGADLSTLKPFDLRAGYVPRKRKLDRGEVAALVTTAKPALAALVALCVAFGCRRSEGLKMRPEDIDLERGQAHVRGTKTEDSDRWVPILSAFRSLVEFALPLLPLGLKERNVNLQLRRACEAAGIPHCSFNDLRRTHASLLLGARVDRDVVRRLLGHRTDRLVNTVYGQLGAGELGAMAEQSIAGTLQLEAPGADLPQELQESHRRRVPVWRLSEWRQTRDRLKTCQPATPEAAEEGQGPAAVACKDVTARWLRSVPCWLGRKSRAA
jgi:integrase